MASVEMYPMKAFPWSAYLVKAVSTMALCAPLRTPVLSICLLFGDTVADGALARHACHHAAGHLA
jgi:hypothetical protein